MRSLYLGAYWKARAESRDESAMRISDFLCSIASIDDSFKNWFQKGLRKEGLNKVDTSKEGIGWLIKTNNKDTTNEPILDLGFNMGIWNGQDVSFSVTIGSFNPRVENRALLEFRGECGIPKGKWLQLINAAVNSFQPDSAVVRSDAENWPLNDGAWLTYSRDVGITESELASE